MEFVDPPKSDIQRKLQEKSSSNSKCTENVDESKSRFGATSIPGATSIYRPDDASSKSVKLPAKIPQGKQFYLVPHLVNTKKSFSLKNKEPKFVPFEPYKAAVSILLP